MDTYIHTYPKMIEACMDTITTTSGMNKDVKTIGHIAPIAGSQNKKSAGCSNTKESSIYNITIGWDVYERRQLMSGCHML